MAEKGQKEPGDIAPAGVRCEARYSTTGKWHKAGTQCHMEGQDIEVDAAVVFRVRLCHDHRRRLEKKHPGIRWDYVNPQGNNAEATEGEATQGSPGQPGADTPIEAAARSSDPAPSDEAQPSSRDIIFAQRAESLAAEEAQRGSEEGLGHAAPGSSGGSARTAAGRTAEGEGSGT